MNLLVSLSSREFQGVVHTLVNHVKKEFLKTLTPFKHRDIIFDTKDIISLPSFVTTARMNIEGSAQKQYTL